jgi:TIR domain
MSRSGLLRGAAFALIAVVLALAGGALQVWQMADHLVFRSLYLTRPPEPGAGIRLVDIAYPADARTGQLAGFRAAQGAALTQLAALPVAPRVVLLDIWISNNPEGTEPLSQGIAALQARGSKVYGAVDPNDRHRKLSADFMASHHESLYTNRFDGYGHTQLGFGFGVLTYQPELILPMKVGELRLTALPVLAVGGQADTLPASLVIPLGQDAVFKPLTHHLANATGQLAPPIPAGATLDYVVVGSFDEDSDNALKRPGPLLLAWALSDLVAGKASVAREPINHPLALLGLAALAALLAMVSFALAFRTLRPRVAPVRWPVAARSLALASFVVATGVLLGLGGILLLAGRVIPLAFPLVCAALGSACAWLGARRWIVDEQVRRELAGGAEERAVQFDVFVSYAHDPPENKAWVKREIVAPLQALRRADGTPYRVFFDEAEIRVGRQWKTEIELALLGTRWFLPVYSARYFERPYCREELELADQLRIEGRLRMFPVALAAEGVPERYLRKLQYIDAVARPDFIDELIAQMLAEPATAAPVLQGGQQNGQRSAA